jgi:deoxyribodipyrimidine photolyase-related protein
MKQAILIFPHQLYTLQRQKKDDNYYVLIEDPLFFGDDQYPLSLHAYKLILHRASMKRYFDEILLQHPQSCTYISYEQICKKNYYILEHLHKKQISQAVMYDPTDYILTKRYKAFADKYDITLTVEESPNFITARHHIHTLFDSKNRYSLSSFYIHQRQRLGILVENGGKPTGGKWSFDTENRKKLPKGTSLPSLPQFGDNPYVQEAQNYITRLFPDNPGKKDGFFYPTNHAEAEDWFEAFLQTRFHNFGPYEDAIEPEESFLFHAVLTPLLNIGLLDPQQIVQKTQNYARRHDIPLASYEGFIRQIIGWREFMRAMYLVDGVRQRTTNALSHTRRLTDHWYDGTTGLEPYDNTVKKLLKTGYAHHIERLMILGNLMLLCEIHPDDVYTWFMEMFVDAYDWVMVPNVYAMSQYADGGTMTTKPYISSSNYILKMSNYPRGDWCEVWDGLYWRFIERHRPLFEGNYRMRMMVTQLDKMKTEKKERIMSKAEQFIEKMTRI